MTLNKKTLAWVLFSSVIFFIIGYTASAQLLTLLEPGIDGIDFVITGTRTAFLFSLTLALVPLLTFVTWRISRIQSFNRKIWCVFIIILTIGAALFVRHQEVKTFFNRIVRPLLLTNGKTRVVYPIDPRNFVYYLFAGVLTGCVFSYLILRQKNPRLRSV